MLPPNYIILNALRAVLNSFQSKTLYLIGAGASAQYIKPKYNLYQDAIQLLVDIGVIPVANSSTHNLSEEDFHRLKIVGSPHQIYKNIDGNIFIDQAQMDYSDYAIHFTPSILKLICALTYSLDKYPICCPEYEIFNSMHKDSLIVTLNHDNLAKAFINKPRLVSLHGVVTPEMKKTIKANLTDIILYEIETPFLQSLYLATKENEKLLLNNGEFLTFLNELTVNGFNYIILIGYSFFHDGVDAYDSLTFELIREYIVDHDCKVIIIDPSPYIIADILTKSINKLRVACYPIFWNKLCYALWNINSVRKLFNNRFNGTDIRRLLHFYNYYPTNNEEKLILEFSDKEQQLIRIIPDLYLKNYPKSC